MVGAAVEADGEECGDEDDSGNRQSVGASDTAMDLRSVALLA